MNRARLISIVFAAAYLAACGGKNTSTAGGTQSSAAAPAPGGFVPTYISDITKIAEAIENVKDEASAHAAAEVITASTARLDAMSKEMDSKTEAERAALLLPHMAEFSQAQMRLATAMQKLVTADPANLKMISDAMDKMPKVD